MAGEGGGALSWEELESGCSLARARPSRPSPGGRACVTVPAAHLESILALSAAADCATLSRVFVSRFPWHYHWQEKPIL